MDVVHALDGEGGGGGADSGLHTPGGEVDRAGYELVEGNGAL